MDSGNKWNADSICSAVYDGTGIKDINIYRLNKENGSIILTFEFFLCYKLSIPR